MDLPQVLLIRTSDRAMATLNDCQPQKDKTLYCDSTYKDYVQSRDCVTNIYKGNMILCE